MEHKDDELPKWFKVTSRIARHCSWGIIVLFFALKNAYISHGIPDRIIGWINIGLIFVGVPAFIFAGPELLNIISTVIVNFLKKFIKNDSK